MYEILANDPGVDNLKDIDSGPLVPSDSWEPVAAKAGAEALRKQNRKDEQMNASDMIKDLPDGSEFLDGRVLDRIGPPLQAVQVDALVRRELIHKWLSKPEEFLAEIEKTGGWPEGYMYVSFFHDGPAGDRYCKFTTYPLRTCWWTTVATADDYYYWKLSDTKKAEIMKQARQQVIKQLR